MSDQTTGVPSRTYISVSDALDYLAIGRSKMYDLLASGAIPYCKVGSRTVIKRTDLDEYMQSVRVDRRGRWGR